MTLILYWKMKNNYIYGKNAVLEAINAGSNIEKIYIEFGIDNPIINKIFSLSSKYKISISRCDKRKFHNLENTIASTPVNAQGVIALLSSYTIYTIDELIEESLAKSKNPIIIALDEINDPQNLGAIARSAECSGCSGLIITEQESSPITPVAVKASAGALEYLPVVKVSSLIQALLKGMEAGFTIIGADMDGEQNYTEIQTDLPLIIVIGGEGKGLRPSTKKHCDILVNIPLFGKINSLNASVSAGIILFDIVRRRNNFKES